MSLELLAKSFSEVKQDFEEKYKEIQIKPKDILDCNPATHKNNVFVMAERIWNDALGVLNANQFYAVSIVGPQGTGKTTIAKEFAKFAKRDDFKIVYAMPEDFLPDVNAWLEKILVDARAKNCLIIDDLSYSLETHPRKTQALVKNLVARFRHVFGGQLFVVYITHRLHAAPPMLRNSFTWIFSAMQAADREDALEVIGKTKEMRDRLQALYNFISRVSIEGARNKIVKFTLGDSEHAFRWGTDEDIGDGRLMGCFNAGKLDVYNSKVSDGDISLTDFRYPKNDINNNFMKPQTNTEKKLVKAFD